MEDFGVLGVFEDFSDYEVLWDLRYEVEVFEIF